MGRIGQIIRGDFPGLIRIHSDMREPGPEDDLLVETADMQMNTKLMYSTAPVRFRMGQNIGGGTELEIRFLADEHFKSSDQGLKIAGIDSLEIRRDVKMRLQMDASGLLPGGKQADSKAAHGKDGQPYAVNPSVQVTDASAVKPAADKPPVEVVCSGPFTFDFVRYVASLDRDVELRQINPNGPSDQLVCTRLDIHFAPKLQSKTSAQPVVIDPGKRQQRDLGQLEPVAIVAEGHPVAMTSPARNAQARGDRIQIALRDQRVRISGGSDAMLTYGTNVLRAPIIDYQHPTPEEETAIGRFRATGPGTLHYVVDPNKPQQVLQAEWQTSVQLGRDKGQPVLALDGRPKIAFAGTGSLSADQIRLYLRELEGKGSEGIVVGGGSGDAQNKLQLAPDRMLATGHVEIASPTFSGHAQSLSATFRLRPNGASNAAAPGGTGSTPAAPNAAPVAAPGATQPQQRYFIDTDQMRLDVFLTGQSAVPSTLACEGHVVLREVPLVATDQQPLEIRGGHLLVDQLDTKSPHITLHGVAPGQAPRSAFAQLAGRGVTVLTDTVELDGGENRMWSDGPGKATLLVARDLAGNPSATPIPLELAWQGGLKFDGQTIYFERDVTAAGMDGKLHCDQLSAKLAAPIQFGQRVEQANINLSEIECRGQVTIENVSRDTPRASSSHEQMQLARLTINQQTGAISGDGPGTIRSTRFGTGMPFPEQQAAKPPLGGEFGAERQAAAPPPPTAAGSKLYFLRVDFHRGLDGNMYTRELTFHERVRTVYGPVDAWEQELDPTRPETLPPDSITLTCDDLRLNEDAVAARAVATSSDPSKRPIGKVQMQAQGDVRIAGQVPNQGEFSVQAGRASYEQAKDAFVLEGDTRTPAKLWRRNGAGVDSPPTEARKIRYVRSTGEVKVEGIQYFEITPSDLQNARRPQNAG